MKPLRALILVLVATTGLAHADAPTARLDRIVMDPAVDEISGLAASRRHPDVLWALNDSGNPAALYALAKDGHRAATLRLRGVVNVDWEDLSLFHDAGRDWLLVADVGDNGNARRELVLYVVAEPEKLEDTEVDVARSLRFTWPHGPRDCEAVAVDVQERTIYLLSKKSIPAELFRLPLDADTRQAPVVAEYLGPLMHIQQPTQADLGRSPLYGKHRARITSMDISADGRRMVVLNYLQAHLYTRDDGEAWADSLTRPPVPLPFPWLVQAEAIAFSADGQRVWIGTERLPSPILELPLPAR